MKIARSAAVFAFLSIVFLNSPHAGAESEWKLARDSEGIKSYTRSVDGSSLYELKAIGVIDASMEVIGEVLRDIAAYPEWQSSCKEARVIEKTGPDDFILYVILKLPVVSDRDVVVKSTAVRDIDRARTYINFGKTETPEIKGDDGLVRMKEFSGQYVLEYITRDRTGVIYSYRADPGKGIPSWAINMFGKDVLHKTLLGLKDMARKNKYTELASKSPDRAVIDGVKSDAGKVREILKRRLNEQIGDKESVERMMQDEELVKLFVEGDGEIARTIFMASGSYDAKKTATQKLLKIHLKKYTRDEKLIERICQDEGVVKAIITGKRQNGMSAVEMINLYLGTAPGKS